MKKTFKFQMRRILILILLACQSSPSVNQSDNNEENEESIILQALQAENDDGSGEQESASEKEDDDETVTKQELLETDIDPMGKMCVTLENDIDTLSTNAKAYFTKAHTKLIILPKPDRRTDEDDMFIYKILENKQYEDIFEECKEFNLGVFNADSSEQVKLILKFMRKKEDRQGQEEGKRDIFWLPLQGNQPKQVMQNANGNYPYISDLGAKLKSNAENLLYVHPEIEGQTFTMCSAVERVGNHLQYIARGCKLNTAVLCVRRKDFINAYGSRLGREKGTILRDMSDSSKGIDAISSYIQANVNPKCKSTQWTEKFSDMVKRHFPIVTETESEHVDKMTLTSLLLQFPQTEKLLALLKTSSKLTKDKVGEILQKSFIGPFVEITVSEDKKTICICPKINFLSEINEFFEKMSGFNNWYDFITLDKHIRVPELILTFVAVITLIVAIAGHCVQRRHVKLKELRHKQRKEKRKKDSDLNNKKQIMKNVQTSPKSITPKHVSETDTPKSQKSVKFNFRVFKRKGKSKESIPLNIPSDLSYSPPTTPTSSPENSPTNTSKRSSSTSSYSSSTPSQSSDSSTDEKNSGGKIKKYV